MSSFNYFEWTPIIDADNPGDNRVTFLELLEQLRADVNRLTDTSGSIGQLDSKLREIEAIIERIKKLSIRTGPGGTIIVSDGTITATTYDNGKISALIAEVNRKATDAETRLRQEIDNRVGNAEGVLHSRIGEVEGKAEAANTLASRVNTEFNTRADARVAEGVKPVKLIADSNSAKIRKLEESVTNTVSPVKVFNQTTGNVTDALQTAITNNTHKRLHIASGRYVLNKTITIPEGFYLSGDGVIQSDVYGTALECGRNSIVEGLSIESSVDGIRTVDHCRIIRVDVFASTGDAIVAAGFTTVTDSRLTGKRAVNVQTSRVCNIVNTVLKCSDDTGQEYCTYVGGVLNLNSCFLQAYNSAAQVADTGTLNIVNSQLIGGRQINDNPVFDTIGAPRINIATSYIDMSNTTVGFNSPGAFQYNVRDNRIVGGTGSNFRMFNNPPNSRGKLQFTGNHVNVSDGKLTLNPLGDYMVSDTDDDLLHTGVYRSGGWAEYEHGIASGHGDQFPTLPGGIPVGTVFWHFNHKRPFWWSGDAWMSADGKTLQELGLE